MSFTVDDISYPLIAPSIFAPNDDQAWEDSLVGGTFEPATVSAARMFAGDTVELQMQPDYNAPSQWNQSANYSWGPISNLVTDPSVGGFAGAPRVLGWNNGGVESNTVENFEMDGRRGEFRMQAATGYGPVGYADFGGVLGAALAQDAYDYATPFESAVSVVRDY